MKRSVILMPHRPVNWASPLNRSLASWWLHLPNRLGGGGVTYRDLCDRNHGTLTNGPTWGGAIGRRGGFGSLSFDGTNDYVNCGASANLNFTSSDFTIAFWQNTTNDGHDGVLFFKGTFATDGYYIQGDGGSSMRLVFRTNQSGASQATNSATFSVAANVWQRWMISRIGGSAQWYLNGIASGTAGTPTSPASSARNFAIGAYDGGASNFYPGRLDSIKIWSRGLSANEAMADYLEEVQGYPTTLNWTRMPTAVEQAGAPGGLAGYLIGGGFSGGNRVFGSAA